MYNHEIQSICSAVQLKYVASLLEQHFYCPYVIIKGEVLSVQAYGVIASDFCLKTTGIA